MSKIKPTKLDASECERRKVRMINRYCYVMLGVRRPHAFCLYLQFTCRKFSFAASFHDCISPDPQLTWSFTLAFRSMWQWCECVWMRECGCDVNVVAVANWCGSNIRLQRKSAILNGSKERTCSANMAILHINGQTADTLSAFIFFSFFRVHFLFIGIFVQECSVTFTPHQLHTGNFSDATSMEHETLGNKFDFGLNQHHAPRSLVILILSQFIYLFGCYFLFCLHLD